MGVIADVCNCTACWVNRCQSVQTGVYFRSVEVGQLVAREPKLGVAHVTQISVSLVFFLFSLLLGQDTYVWNLLWGHCFKTSLLVQSSVKLPTSPAVIFSCWCLVGIGKQSLVMKVLLSSLLLLAAVYSVYSQAGKTVFYCNIYIYM